MKKKKIILLIVLLLTCTSVSAMQVVTCGGVDNVPYKLLKFVGNVITTVQIAVPIILAIIGAIDFAKAMTSEEKKMNEASRTFIKRIIYALLVFFVVALVQVLFSFLEDKNDSFSCASCMLGNKCNVTVLNVGKENPSNSKSKKVTKIKIAEKKSSMTEGENFRLKVEVTPKNATNKNMNYKSSKQEFAIISYDGVITAIKKGKTTITVTSQDNKKVSAKFTLNVKAKPEKPKNNTTEVDGSGASGKIDGSVKGFNYFNQAKSSTYGSVPFCGGIKTLHSSGCGAMAFAMVANNLVDKTYNPAMVANYLCHHGHESCVQRGDCGLPEFWFTNADFLNKFGLKSKHIIGDVGNSQVKESKEKMLKELNKGKMLIIHVAIHYIALASGGQDKIIVLDSGSQVFNGTYTIDQLWNLISDYRGRCSNSGNCGLHGAYSFEKK